MEGWFVPGSNDPFAAVADHLGRYRYEGLRCGSYKLQVTHPTRRMSTVVDVEVRSPAGTFDVDLDVAQIEGRVVGEDGSALAGIDVQAHPAGGGAPDSENWRMVLTEDDRGSPRVDYRQEARPAAKTDAAGHYVLRGVRPGEPLAVVASGEMVVHGTVDGVLLGPDEVRRGVDFSLKSAGLVEVTLATGAPAGRGRGWYRVRAVRLGAEGKEEPVQSSYLGDWNRTCRLRSLAPGRYRIEFARGGEEDGPSPDAQEVDVVAGQVARVSFQAR